MWQDCGPHRLQGFEVPMVSNGLRRRRCCAVSRGKERRIGIITTRVGPLPVPALPGRVMFCRMTVTGRIDSPMACGSWFAHGISTRVVQIFEPVWSNHQVFSLTPREPRVSEYFLRDRVRGDAGRVAAERGKDPRDSAIAAVVRAILKRILKNLNFKLLF